MNVLINGCSHTEASECKKGLAEFLQENLDADVTNIAKGGGSNHRILRTTMEYCETCYREWRVYEDHTVEPE